ncbi:uncharacterized protein p120ctn isoform X12 [Panulirus ornatus]|uniref:uncharacterized protein p120ctn isoform X12 n=1 Tax=Panulirus ornatus TaxID=150431 RepID=UPI003A891480
MPRSSVYVTLNWPSKNGDLVPQKGTSPQSQDTIQVPLSSKYKEKNPLQRDGYHQEKLCQKNQRNDFVGSCIPSVACELSSLNTPTSTYSQSGACFVSEGNKGEEAVQHVAGTKPKIKQSSKEKLCNLFTSKAPSTGIQAKNACFSSHTSGVPHLDTSHSLDSPLWSGTEHAVYDCADLKEASIDNGKFSGSANKVNHKSHQKPRTRAKPRNLTSEGRKITRSLSASCVSVSTNTDPRDFLELAKVSVTNATLPGYDKGREPTVEVAVFPDKREVFCPLGNKVITPDGKIASGSDETTILTSENPHDKQIVLQNICPQNIKTNDAETHYLGDSAVKEEIACEKELSEAVLECPSKEMGEYESLISERCAGDGCDDINKGFIELPTYNPNESLASPATGKFEQFSCTANEGLLAGHCYYPPFCKEITSVASPPGMYFGDSKGLTALEHRPLIDDKSSFVLINEQKYPTVLTDLKIDNTCFVQPSNLPTVLTYVTGSPSSSEQDRMFSTFKPSATSPLTTFQPSHSTKDQLDPLYLPSHDSNERCQKSTSEFKGNKSDLQLLASNNEERVFHTTHSSPVAENEHLIQAARRRQLDKDISVESCPDVVLQTLEGEGISTQGKSLKKTVTFLLPPEHWDSLISLRENNIGGYPQSGYAELDGTLLPPNGEDPYRNTPSPGMQGIPQDRYVRWRDPDLHEVIDFLSNPNNVVKANAAAYLQHLCYMDDPTKQKTRILGGIPPLVALLTHDLPELHRNACGALRNLSYGRQNDENKRAIKDAQGIPALVRLLRKTPDNEIKELVTGILWNLSSCEDLKHSIIDDALTVIVSHVIIPCSGWDGGEVERDPNVDVWWSTVFKNASGVLRNVSSAGEYARTKLRQCHGLVDSLLTVIKSAIQGSSHDNKSVENCVCILRNLSYRCQEVEDPNYDKNQPPTQSRAAATAKDGEGEGTDTCGRSSEPKDNLCDNLGCFGGSRKKKEAVGGAVKETSAGQRSAGPRTEPLRGMELLWQPEVVVGPYLALLSDCSNPETLEAAAGALQNLAACYWQPSIDVRAAVRKEKGLPILVELLRMEVDRVVCAVATALRNLAIDQRNKELIGKYAMRDLVQKLPSGNTHDSGTSDETIAAVLATLNEVIKKSAEFSRSLLDVGGVERLVNMTRHRGRYSVRVVKFASQVLFSMWGHQELREVYKKAGWKEQDFVSKSVAARNATPGGANSPTANNTLNRPMASQGGTRYEDRTIQRGQAKSHQRYAQGQEVPMADMGYGSSGGMVPPAGGVRLYPPVQGKPGEPVYAKVNRDKKRNRQYDGLGPQYGSLGGADDWGGPVYSGSPTSSPNFNNSSSVNNNNSNTSNNNGVLLDKADGQAGDSWV